MDKTELQILKESFKQVGVEYSEYLKVSNDFISTYLVLGSHSEIDEDFDVEKFIVGKKYFQFINGDLVAY